MPKPLCPFSTPCGLATCIGMVAALRVWESFYCEGSFERCERYRLHQSGRDVPRRLLPNGRLLDEFGPEPRPEGASSPPPARLAG